MWSVKTGYASDSNQLGLNHSVHKAQLKAAVKAKKHTDQVAPQPAK